MLYRPSVPTILEETPSHTPTAVQAPPVQPTDRSLRLPPLETSKDQLYDGFEADAGSQSAWDKNTPKASTQTGAPPSRRSSAIKLTVKSVDGTTNETLLVDELRQELPQSAEGIGPPPSSPPRGRRRSSVGAVSQSFAAESRDATAPKAQAVDASQPILLKMLADQAAMTPAARLNALIETHEPVIWHPSESLEMLSKPVPGQYGRVRMPQAPLAAVFLTHLPLLFPPASIAAAVDRAPTAGGEVSGGGGGDDDDDDGDERIAAAGLREAAELMKSGPPPQASELADARERMKERATAGERQRVLNETSEGRLRAMMLELACEYHTQHAHETAAVAPCRRCMNFDSTWLRDRASEKLRRMRAEENAKERRAAILARAERKDRVRRDAEAVVTQYFTFLEQVVRVS